MPEYIYDETYKEKGWFDAVLTIPGWFDTGFSESGGVPPEPPTNTNQGMLMMGIGG